MAFTRSGLWSSTAAAAFLFATSLAKILQPNIVLEDMSKEQLISMVRDLKPELAAAAPADAPQPEPKRSTLMRSAKPSRVALSVDGDGRVERIEQVASGALQEKADVANPAKEPPDPMKNAKPGRVALSTDGDGRVERVERSEQGDAADPGPSANGAGPAPPPRAPALSDAALLQALFPADDLPAEHREDFHRALHGDPEMARKLLGIVREHFFRSFRNHEGVADLEEHELEESGGEEFDDLEFDDKGSDDEELDDASDNDTAQEVPGNAQGEDIAERGLDAAHAEKLEQEMANLKVIQLASTERMDKRGNATAELQLEEAVIDMMSPNKTDKPSSTNKTAIVTGLIGALDNVPEPIDAYDSLDIIPNEQEIVAFEREVMGGQVQDQEELGADDENNGNFSNGNGTHRLGRGKQGKTVALSERSLLSKRVRAHGDGGTTWPKSGGSYTIRFCRGSGLSGQAWSEFKKAYKRMHEHCEDLNFVEDSSNCELTVTGDKGGCSATVGYANGENNLNLRDGDWWGDTFTGTCATTGIAQHEIGHALGMFHEQKRPDRKVSYMPWNVQSGKEKNFETTSEASTQESYDYKSLMHYGCKAFAKDIFHDTLRANRRRSFWDGHAGRQDCSEMGQRSGLSYQDVRQLQRMYSCTIRRRRGSGTVTYNHWVQAANHNMHHGGHFYR